MALSGTGPAPRSIKYPLLTDAADIEAFAKYLAEQLANDAKTGQGKLSERPAAGTRGTLFMVTEGPEQGLWWDNGAAWERPAPVSGKSIIATEETRENVAYGLLPTPDQVELVLPASGLIAVMYQATWQESVSKAASAAIFLGANQVQVAAQNSLGAVQTSIGGTAGKNVPLSTYAEGLTSLEGSAGYPGDATTGQVVGLVGAISGGGTWAGGPCYIFAAAGTYKISVQFKSSSGNVKVKNRKLWAWVVV